MFQASDQGLVFLVSSHIQKQTESHFIRVKDVPIIQENPRDLGVLCQRILSLAKRQVF